MKKQAKILIVDDEPDILLMLRIDLEAEGYETCLAADGETALRRIVEDRPDLVLLDVMMPVIDGWGVLRRLNGMDSPARVVVLSAKAADHDAAKALAMGALEYITKPFDSVALLVTVNHILLCSPADLEAGRQRRLRQLEPTG